jgi:hypothetical protein
MNECHYYEKRTLDSNNVSVVEVQTSVQLRNPVNSRLACLAVYPQDTVKPGSWMKEVRLGCQRR